MSDDRLPLALRQRIMDAARRTFARKGFAETSVREVAADALTTKPMIYYYFGSKTGLLETLLDDARVRLTGDLAQIVRGREPPGEKLVLLIRRLLERMTAEPDAIAILQRPWPRSANTVEQSTQHGSPLADTFVASFNAILAEGEAAGAFRPVSHDLTARLVLGALDANEAGAPPSAEAIADLLLHGLSGPTKAW